MGMVGALAPGRWAAVTPCFRPERLVDPLRRLCFMKLELLVWGSGILESPEGIAEEAASCMTAFGDHAPDLVRTPEGLDLQIAGIEVGSYGRRTAPCGTSYLYGTGLAEPRFTLACRRADALSGY